MPAPPSHCAAFLATSLDGYIARPDGALDWLDAANATVPAGEDCGYAEFMAGVDALVMGRATFDTACGFPQWPYGATPVLVWSDTLAALPPQAPPTVRLHPGPPAALVDAAAAQGWRRLYVDGGRTVQAFLAAGLLDEITVTVVPVLLGQGRPLFGPLPADVALRHLATRSWPFGFVQSRYAVVRGA